MDASLDVFVILGDDSFLWIGCARTDDEAIYLIRTQGLTKGDRYFTHSRTTGCRTFYGVGREYDIIQLKQPPAGIGLSPD
jgi:hypothetical protein